MTRINKSSLFLIAAVFIVTTMVVTGCSVNNGDDTLDQFRAVALSPDRGETGVETSSNVTLQFSGNIKEGSAYGNIRVAAGGTDVEIQKSISGNTLTITPTYGLDPATQYTVYIPAHSVARVSDGRTINDNDQYNFTTRENYIYVSNSGDGNVSVIKESDKTAAVSAVGVGVFPTMMATSPSGEYIYVLNENESTMSVIRVSDNSVIQTVDLGGWPPYDLTASPDGNYVYVLMFGDPRIHVINTSTWNIERSIDTTPGTLTVRMAISPNGQYLYVGTDPFTQTIQVYNAETGALATTMNAGDGIFDVAITPNGQYLYVSKYDFTVSVFDLSNYSEVATVDIGGDPVFLAMSPDGNRVAVVNNFDEQVAIIRTSDNTVTDTIGVGANPAGAAFSPDGSHVYVASYDEGKIYTVSIQSMTSTGSFAAGTEPLDVVVIP